MKSRQETRKGASGLKHFSLKVCEKVKSKGTTSYNEVADELVTEFSADPRSLTGDSGGPIDEPFDQKNIRRRVYDALNVLMAIGIITKDKKTIKWIGLPVNSAQEVMELEKVQSDLRKKIDEKREEVRSLLLRQIAYKKLVERNKANQAELKPNTMIKVPFVCITTNVKTTIDCQIAEDRSQAFFSLNNTFEFHDDVAVLRRIGLIPDKPQGLANVKSLLPKSLHSEMDLWCKTPATATATAMASQTNLPASAQVQTQSPTPAMAPIIKLDQE